MGQYFTVPLVYVRPKHCKNNENEYELPDFARPKENEEDIDVNIQSALAEIEIKNENNNQSKVQKNQSDQIDWLKLDEVEFLPSESDLYQRNVITEEKIEDSKLKEKLLLSMLDSHLQRYCEEKLKCSLEDLVYEFQRSNTNHEINEEIQRQKDIIGSKERNDFYDLDHT